MYSRLILVWLAKGREARGDEEKEGCSEKKKNSLKVNEAGEIFAQKMSV